MTTREIGLYRRILSQPWRCSAMAMYANFGVNNFEATTRKLNMDLHKD